MKSKSSNPKLLYSIKEIMEIIPISKSGLYAAIKKDLIPHKKIGGRVFILASFVDDLSPSSQKHGA
ncbi:MAG: helix-turn-helix domain-containing protein [Veillonellales bacterium]